MVKKRQENGGLKQKWKSGEMRKEEEDQKENPNNKSVNYYYKTIVGHQRYSILCPICNDIKVFLEITMWEQMVGVI